jgi:two-component system response regulator AlgR
VRLERLAQAMARCRKHLPATGGPAGVGAPDPSAVLLVQERGRLVKVPVSDIVYLKAELKYVTLRTASHSYVLDDSLTDLEERLGSSVIRVHRNALVARAAMRRLERRDDPDGAEGWAVQVGGGEWLTVSRRQVPAVKEALTEWPGHP